MNDLVAQRRQEASAILDKDASNWSMRSCWNCNLAHEHLKQAEYPIRCFDCGHWYYKGVDITIMEPDKA
jgi:PHP family Zn ribbon phosphoesterase